ncbi:MAG: hypothetical protein IPI63_11805 [Methanothrix sp.]|uniref:hypothetical protein n=1 Tax=Methanothrix sp. TaxID=90426 RepID=UPI0025D39BEC|nr:hypothetical protein [Methanothrix sp.]MBK7387347.1 hypothetical protein [Methanothrix sp.]
MIRLREFTQAEAEIFIDPRDKSHPRFSDIQDIRMKFYSQEAQERGEEEERWSFGQAVERGVVAPQILAIMWPGPIGTPGGGHRSAEAALPPA